MTINHFIHQRPFKIRVIIKKFPIQNENHHQEIREYGHLPLLQFIQDDNQTFHPLKAIQDVGHYQEIPHSK